MQPLKERKFKLTLGGNGLVEVSYAQISVLLHEWKKDLFPPNVDPGVYIANQLGLPAPLSTPQIHQIDKAIQRMERSYMEHVANQIPVPEGFSVEEVASNPTPSTSRAPETSPSSVLSLDIQQAQASMLWQMGCMFRFWMSNGKDHRDFARVVHRLAGGSDQDFDLILKLLGA